MRRAAAIDQDPDPITVDLLVGGAGGLARLEQGHLIFESGAAAGMDTEAKARLGASEHCLLAQEIGRGRRQRDRRAGNGLIASAISGAGGSLPLCDRLGAHALRVGARREAGPCFSQRSFPASSGRSSLPLR